MSRSAAGSLIAVLVAVAWATELANTAEHGTQECDSTGCQDIPSNVSLLQVALEPQVGCPSMSGIYTERGTLKTITVEQQGCDVTVQYPGHNEQAGTLSGVDLVVQGFNAPGKVLATNGDVEFTDHGYWGKVNPCPATIEYAIDLCMDKFGNRDEAITDIRNYLESLDENTSTNTPWFKHKTGGEDVRMVKADYFLVNGNTDLLSRRNLQVRFRKDVGGDKIGKADFSIKFKQPTRGFPLRPLTPGVNSPDKDKWSCKREDNTKYLFPGDDIILEAQEQQGRYKNKDDETAIFDSADNINTMGDIVARFPGFAKFFWLPERASLSAQQPSQWRYIFDDVKMELNTQDSDNDAQTAGSFTLWYNSEADMRNGTNPIRGEWSFKIKEGEDTWPHKTRAEKILKLVGDKFRCGPN